MLTFTLRIAHHIALKLDPAVNQVPFPANLYWCVCVCVCVCVRVCVLTCEFISFKIFQLTMKHLHCCRYQRYYKLCIKRSRNSELLYDTCIIVIIWLDLLCNRMIAFIAMLDYTSLVMCIKISPPCICYTIVCVFLSI